MAADIPISMPYLYVRVRAVTAVFCLAVAGLLTVRPAGADLSGSRVLLTPQIIAPIGDLGELANVGAGIGIEWYRPIDFESSFVLSAATLGFRRQNEPSVLYAVDGLTGLADEQSAHEFDVLALSFSGGVKYATADLFASLRVGALYTRIEERTVLYLGSRRGAGLNSTPKLGPLIAISGGIERGGRPFAGVQLNYAPGERGPSGQSHFTWLSFFITI